MYGMAAPDLPGITRPHRHRCDETENPGRNQPPGPLALLPVVRSPSRSCHHDRWWALTPPVRPLPALPRSTGGIAFCCGCSQDAALAGLPPLAVSWGDLVPLPGWSPGRPGCRTGSREVPLGSSNHKVFCNPATAHPSIHKDYTTRREPYQITGACVLCGVTRRWGCGIVIALAMMYNSRQSEDSRRGGPATETRLEG
jgi:hypothetical protein